MARDKALLLDAFILFSLVYCGVSSLLHQAQAQPCAAAAGLGKQLTKAKQGGGARSTSKIGGSAPSRDHKGKAVVTPTPQTPHGEDRTSSMKWSDCVTKGNDKNIAGQFYKFLQKITETGEFKHFYEEQIKNMKERKAVVMDIFYSHLEKTDPILAMTVCNNYHRLEFHLKDMFGRFVKVIMPNVPDSVCQSLQLKFHGMPIRHRSLIDILNRNILIKYEDVYGYNNQVLKVTNLGSRLWRAGFAYILRAHIKGKSWFGNFNIHAIEVKNGDEFIIRAEPSEHTPKGAMLDLQKLFMELIPHFNKKGVMPPYFKQLKIFLLTISEDVLGNHSNLKWFRKYLLNHLALAAPLRRAHLINDIHRCCKMMDDDEHRDMPFKDSLRRSNDNWQKVVSKDTELNKVYTFKPKHLRVQNSTQQSSNSSVKMYSKQKVHAYSVQNPSENLLVDEGVFDNTYKSMAMFLRHFFEHALDNSKKKSSRCFIKNKKPLRKLLNYKGKDCSSIVDEIKGVQQAKKLDEYEVLTAIHLGTEIQEMIWYLMLDTGFEGILESVWEGYMYMDDVENFDL